MAGMSAERKPPSIRTVWGIAKSPELRLEDEDLYAVVYRETGKESLRKLTAGELSRVIRALQEMKDSARAERGPGSGRTRAETPGRWSSGGSCIRRGGSGLERSAGERLARRMFQVERIEWLAPAQCGKLIEALKAIHARGRRKEAQP